jgi:hypothetical protein
MTRRRIPQEARIAIAAAFGLTCLGELVGDLSFAALIVPVVFVLVCYAMTRIPVRDSISGLMFLALVLQDPSDSIPVKFEAPFAGSGAALLSHLNAAARDLGISWAVFSLMDLFLVVLLFIALSRRARGATMDLHESVPIPRPMIQLMYLSFAGTAWVWTWGIVTGGDFGKSLWQLNRVMYLPLIFYLFQFGLRGPQDFARLFKVVLVASIYKSLLALYVVYSIELPPDPRTGSTRPPWATSHQDSVLFAMAFVTVLAILLEGAGGRRWANRLAALVLPLLGAGIWANNRRTAWVQVGLVFVTVYLLTSKENPLKKKIQRTLYVTAPLLVAYVAAGWGGGGPLFKPVHLLRSVVDAKSDGSSNWRELENFDLMETFKTNPVLGTGYGHPYLEIIKLPPVGYDLELYCPHNSLLGIWAYGGVVGYTALTLLWVAGVYFAVRTYHASRDPSMRAAALASFGSVVVYSIQSWGDLGLGTWIGVFVMGASLATAGKLAVVSRQWEPDKLEARVARDGPTAAYRSV